MNRLLLLAACVALLPGCLASFGLQVGNVGAPATQPSVGSGGSFSSSSVNLHLQSGTAGGAVAGAVVGAVVGTVVGASVLETPFGGAPGPAPSLDPTRVVREQDCTKSLQDSAANLRCR